MFVCESASVVGVSPGNIWSSWYGLEKVLFRDCIDHIEFGNILGSVWEMGVWFHVTYLWCFVALFGNIGRGTCCISFGDLCIYLPLFGLLGFLTKI